jgi:7-carboxy-7-deazaguanine synthase
MYKVVEKFVSINGEGTKSGELAVFIRFQKCNLSCSYCDTQWACTENAPYTMMSSGEIVKFIEASGASNVTLTGGEPLLQTELENLLKAISQAGDYFVEIETNGSRSIGPLSQSPFRPSFTMDYKLPSSNMESHMDADNFNLLTWGDTLKFVCGSHQDLIRAKEIIDQYHLIGRTQIFFSPVFGKLSAEAIVSFMIDHKLSGVRVQLQMHKFIWDPNARGV